MTTFTWIFLGIWQAIKAHRNFRRRLREIDEQMREVENALGGRKTEAEMSAEIRARQLLKRVIGGKAYDKLYADGYIDIPSRQHKGARYRISAARNGGVALWLGNMVTAAWCIYVPPPLTDADEILTLIMLARYQEATIWRVGNRTR